MPSGVAQPEQERREVRGPAGRRIVFHVAGPGGGDLVVFHTGTPGTSYLYSKMIRECAERGLRIVCPARPGYGGSDRMRGRSYADNPADTAVVADELGAESFFTMGHSGGGGPALADAALLGDRVRAAAVSAALAPRLEMGSSWSEGLDRANGDELEAIEAGEPALRGLLESWAEKMREKKTGKQIAEDPDFSRFYASVDRACLKGEYLDFLVKSYSLSVTPGVDGWVDDDFAFYGDWGFDLSRIAVPVTIWLGRQDRVIPPAHAEWLAAHVPGARLSLKPDDGHISLLECNFGEMLDEMLALA